MSVKLFTLTFTIITIAAFISLTTCAVVMSFAFEDAVDAVVGIIMFSMATLGMYALGVSILVQMGPPPETRKKVE